MMVSRVISKNDYPLSIRISIVTIILKTDLKCELDLKALINSKNFLSILLTLFLFFFPSFFFFLFLFLC